MIEKKQPRCKLAHIIDALSKFLMIEERFTVGLDNHKHVETVAHLSRKAQ